MHEQAGQGLRASVLLLDVGTRLASSLDEADAARIVVDAFVPAFADSACLHVRTSEDEVHLVAVAAQDPALRAAVDAHASRFPARLQDAHGAGRVIRTGEPEVYLHLTPEKLDAGAADDTERRLLRDLGPRSSIVLPLRQRGRALGALTLLRTGGRAPFTPDEVDVARDLADRAATTLENARLFRDERAARDDARRARLLLEAQNEASPDGIFFQGADGRTAWYNRRLLELWEVDSSVTTKATLGERLAAVMDRLADPEAFARVAFEMEQEPHRTMRLDVRSKSGRTFDCHTAPVLGPDGGYLGRVWYYRDVTAQRAMEGELAAARRELAQNEKLALIGTLVSGVAHEVRTPLAYVSNHAHVLLRAAQRARDGATIDPALIESSAAAIVEGTDRMNKLVLELRRFARQSDGATDAADVDEAARGAAHLFGATHRGRVQLESLLGGAPRAAIDPVQLQQVILNLVENAMDASPPGARVRLETRKGLDGPELRVRDWGSGIPADVVERMWEPFFTTKREGTGLGLSIVRRIVEGVGGSVRCESVVGKGTTFIVQLPPAKADEDAA